MDGLGSSKWQGQAYWRHDGGQTRGGRSKRRQRLEDFAGRVRLHCGSGHVSDGTRYTHIGRTHTDRDSRVRVRELNAAHLGARLVLWG